MTIKMDAIEQWKKELEQKVQGHNKLLEDIRGAQAKLEQMKGEIIFLQGKIAAAAELSKESDLKAEKSK